MPYYKLLILDTKGNKYHYHADEDNQHNAEAQAEEWVTEGGAEIDWIEVLETNDHRGIIDTGW
jgi:hypothetical protein